MSTRGGGLAVVVGASGAFGTATVARLVEAGHAVVAVGRRAASIEPLIARHGDRVRACAADIGDDAAVDTIRSAVGDLRVRAVVHGPGVAVAGGISAVPTAALTDAVNVKVGGLLRLVRAVDDRLDEGARIVAIAGHYGLEPTQYAAAAGVANAALINLVRQLSLVYGPRGVTAHTVAPGPADTDRLRRVAADRAEMQSTSVEEVLDEMRTGSSIGRLTTPDEVAWAVITLLAPEAAATTGSTLMLDAGRRRGLP